MTDTTRNPWGSADFKRFSRPRLQAKGYSTDKAERMLRLFGAPFPPEQDEEVTDE